MRADVAQRMQLAVGVRITTTETEPATAARICPGASSASGNSSWRTRSATDEAGQARVGFERIAPAHPLAQILGTARPRTTSTESAS